jgi:HEAT repeat protein
MLDLAGKDTYPQGHTNNAIRLKPMYGAGLDAEGLELPAPGRVIPLEFPLRKADPAPTARLYAARSVDAHHPIEHLFRRAISEHPDAKEAWQEVKQRAVEVLPYLINRLNSPNIEYGLKFGELVDHLGTDSIPLLIAGLSGTQDDGIAGRCCSFLARFDEKARVSIPAVLPLLDRDRTRVTALYTLGHMRAAEAFSRAMEALDSDRELVRLRATQALGRIGDRRATARLIRKLDDELYPVRYAAEDALVAFGKSSIAPLAAAYRRASDRARPHILEALARLGDERGFRWGLAFYKNDHTLVREAVLGSLAAALTKRGQAPGEQNTADELRLAAVSASGTTEKKHPVRNHLRESANGMTNRVR